MGYYYYSDGDLDQTPREVRVELADRDNDYSENWPEALEEFISWLRELAADAPHGADVRIEFKGGGYDDDTYARLTMYYNRSETADEVTARVARAKAYREAAVREQERKERAALAALKAKYEA